MRATGKEMQKNPQMTPESIAKARDYRKHVRALRCRRHLPHHHVRARRRLVDRRQDRRGRSRPSRRRSSWRRGRTCRAFWARYCGGVQGLVLDESKLTGQLAFRIGPARFFDPDTTNPLLYQVLGRFDLMTLWVTVLLAIGLYVTGKVSKGQAIMFGILIWIVGSSADDSRRISGDVAARCTPTNSVHGGVAFERMPGAHITTRSRPSRFATYNASSARARNEPDKYASVTCSHAMPTLTVTE